MVMKTRRNLFRISAWVIILGGLALSAAAFAVVYHGERQKLKANFERVAENRYAALQREIDAAMGALSSVKAFYLHANVVTRSEFRDFTASLLIQNPGIQALLWAPLISRAEREKYEFAARRDGFGDFQILEEAGAGKTTRAGGRDEYFPVYFVEPHKGNESVLGYDLVSNPLYRETLDRSRDTGEVAATARAKLEAGKADEFGFLVFSPIYRNKTPGDPRQGRRDRFWGFAVGVYRIHDIVQRALAYLNPEGIDFYLYEDPLEAGDRLLHAHSSRLRTPSEALNDNAYPPPRNGLQIVRTLQVADRRWRVLFVPTPDYAARGRSWQPWGVLAAGLLLTGLLAGFLILSVKRAEEVRLSEERFRGIFEEGPIGIVLANPDHKIVAANRVLCQLLGYSEQELVGRNIIDLSHGEDIEKIRMLTEQLLEGAIPRFRWENRYVRKGGGIVWVNLTATTFRGEALPVPYFLGIVEDLTESRKAAERIHLLHYYDSLTGLPNRVFHKELVKRSIAHAQRHKETFALIYIGLDYFQRINDTFGQGVGDVLLKTIADRLVNTLRKSDYVARSGEEDGVNMVSRAGGDEFVLLAHDLKQSQDAAIAASRLLKEISAPCVLDGREVFMTASIGIALYPADGTEVDDLLNNAEKAMKHTKSEGKNNYHFYSESMNASVRELLALESDLHKALERDELVLYYQPKVNAVTRTVTGMEALIRWKHPERGLIPPGRFIPLAETSGLILPIGEWVIRAVCRQIKTWRSAGYKQIKVAMNVSGRQLDQQDLIKIVQEALQDTLIPPRCLEMEITESTLMRNPEKASRILNELNALGLRIEIDDFGTGYSSLNYLKRLPLDFLKIDQSFVKGVATDPRDQAIVRTTIAMAHSLNLSTIAEGVETEEQLAFLQEHGCDEIQGYLFSRPVPAAEIPAILAKGRL